MHASPPPDSALPHQPQHTSCCPSSPLHRPSPATTGGTAPPQNMRLQNALCTGRCTAACTSTKCVCTACTWSLACRCRPSIRSATADWYGCCWRLQSCLPAAASLPSRLHRTLPPVLPTTATAAAAAAARALLHHRMRSTCCVAVSGVRNSGRFSRMRSSAGFREKVRLNQAPKRTGRTGARGRVGRGACQPYSMLQATAVTPDSWPGEHNGLVMEKRRAVPAGCGLIPAV
jgi:hypothetical protein